MNYSQSEVQNLYQKVKNEQYIKLSLPFLNALGAEESALLLYLEGLTTKNEREKQQKYYRDGFYWTRFTYTRLHQRINMGKSVRSLQRLVYTLETKGYLISMPPDPEDFNPSKWYRVNPSKMIEFYMNNDFTDLPPDDGMDDDGLDNFGDGVPILSRGGHHNLGGGVPILSRGVPIMENILDQQLDQKLNKHSYNADAENVFFDADAKTDLGVEASEATLRYASTAKKIEEPEPQNVSLVENQDLGKEGQAPPSPPRAKRRYQTGTICDGDMQRQIERVYQENKPEKWKNLSGSIRSTDVGKLAIALIHRYEQDNGDNGFDVFLGLYKQMLVGMQSEPVMRTYTNITIHSTIRKFDEFLDIASSNNTKAALNGDEYAVSQKNHQKASVRSEVIDDLTAHLHPRNNQHLETKQRGIVARQGSELQKRLDGIYRAIAPTLDDDTLLDKEKLKAVLSSEMSAAA